LVLDSAGRRRLNANNNGETQLEVAVKGFPWVGSIVWLFTTSHSDCLHLPQALL